MKDLHIKYKADTGHSIFIEIDSLLMTDELDTYPLEGLKTVEEVINLIDSCDNEWSIPMSLIPSEYNECDNLKIYRPDYVEWLENQII